MRNRILRAPEAAKLLLSILPVLRTRGSTEIGAITVEREVRASCFLREAIETQDLEPLLDAPEEVRVMVARRITAFALVALHESNRTIAKIADGGDGRAKLFAAMHAILHQAPFDFGRRFREERRRP